MSTLTSSTTQQVAIPGHLDGTCGATVCGYTAGLVAEALEDSATVRLLMPPPLDVPLDLGRDADGAVRLRHGGETIAVGFPAGLPEDTGPVPPDDSLLTTPWTPSAEMAVDGVVEPRFVWAALDRPSGAACMPPDRDCVLATMTATIEAPVYPGAAYVVVAWPRGSEGRRHRAGAALYDAEGHRVAVAETLWITLKETS